MLLGVNASKLGLVFVRKTPPNFNSAAVWNMVKCVSLCRLNGHYSQLAWPQTGRVHMDKGFSHSGSAAVSRCLSQVGSLFGWPLWTISSLYTLCRSRPLTTQSENIHTIVQYELKISHKISFWNQTWYNYSKINSLYILKKTDLVLPCWADIGPKPFSPHEGIGSWIPAAPRTLRFDRESWA